ncbi:MAG TPA: hypothetical protein VM536_02640 [Chloroflexia bacterium]|nr:hypothetical protein [Chloroflexia bacterium]
MAIYLALVGLLSIIALIGWLVTGAPMAGWLLLALLAAGLLPLLRFLLRRGAPDDKFPWE